MKIKIIKIVSFLIIFILLLNTINNILNFKRELGNDQIKSFYKEKRNSIDVLFIGSSRVFCNISPAVLFKNYGISSFSLATSESPFWNNYYLIKEALKKQKPKLIVLEIGMSPIGIEYNHPLSIIPALKMSINKINTIIECAPKISWNEYFNPLLLYHSRYNQLSTNDFYNNYNHLFDNKYYYNYNLDNFKGYIVLTNSVIVEYKNINTSETVKLYPKMEKYYRKIIELVKTNNIELLTILAPFDANESYYLYYNSVKEIANEYNIDFLDCYLNSYKYLDFTADFNDASHLNYNGAYKFSMYLGEYLKKNYDFLPDRRGNPKYSSWEANVKHENKHIYNIKLKKIDNIYKYINNIKNIEDYIISITLLGDYKKDDPIIKDIINSFNINNLYLKNVSYVIEDKKIIYSSAGLSNYLFYKNIGKYNDLVLENGNKLSINRINYIKTQNGINILIYDKLTEEIVDNIYLEYKENSIDATIKR